MRNTTWLKDRVDALRSAGGYVLPTYPRLGPQGKGFDYRTALKMDSNENLLYSHDLVARVQREAAEEIDLRFYPRSEFEEFIQALSKYLHLPPEYLVISNGGDQLIDFIIQNILKEGERVVSVSPTFSFYKLRSEMKGAKYVSVPLMKDFSLDVEALQKELGDAAIFFMCSPNNPTGNQFDRASVEKLIKSFEGLVVADEAYVQFADYNLSKFTRVYENLVVLRSFSKVFGLAGGRLGCMIADPFISEAFAEKIQYPYPVNSYTLKVATKLLRMVDEVNTVLKRVKEERARLLGNLRRIPGIRAFESHSNFILFEVGERFDEVWRRLMERQILVRRIGDVPQATGCLRVTVGPPSANDAFIQQLQEVLEER